MSRVDRNAHATTPAPSSAAVTTQPLGFDARRFKAMERAGFETGYDLGKLIDTARWVGEKIGKTPASSLNRASSGPSVNGTSAGRGWTTERPNWRAMS